MKTVIEHAVNPDFLKSDSDAVFLDAMEEFNLILQRIEYSANERELRARLILDQYTHFYYGFGHHHFWVKQFNFDDENLLAVYFQDIMLEA